MIRKLYACLAVTALLSVGYVGITHANLIQTPRPSTGSTQPTPPAAAQAAGFTTLALNLDFTGATTSSFHGTTYDSHDLSDANSWLSCQYATGGGNTPNAPVFWVAPGWGNAVPCSDVSITTDGSTNVLHLLWTLADQSNGSNANELDTWTVNEPANTGHDFPQGGQYVEFTFRTTSASQAACTQPCGAQVVDVWSWPTGSGSVEWDFIEAAANGFSYSACHDYGATSNCSTPSAWGYLDVTQYHTFGLRLTTDGTNMDQCGYLDGVFQGCGSEFTPSSGISVTEQRGYMRITVGTLGGFTAGNNIEAFIKSFRVWACSTWATSPCTGTVLTGSP